MNNLGLLTSNRPWLFLLLAWQVSICEATIIGVDVIPACPRSADTVTIRVRGEFPDLCYHFDSSIVERVDSMIIVETWIETCYPNCGVCSPAIMTYDTNNVLGVLPPASYTVLVRERLRSPLGLRLTDSARVGFTVSGDTPSAVLETDPPMPGALIMSQNFPNPFNNRTTIEFTLNEAAEVRVEVFDVIGRKVATILGQNLPPGSHRVAWNGIADSGGEVSSGVYFLRIQAGALVESRRMVLLK